jgi:hypothetical protein
MDVSPRAKLILAVGVVAGLLLYLLVVDLGVNAGRVHHGVSVPGLDLGGLTEAEAIPKLEELGTTLRDAPIVFSTPGFDCRVAPRELGWGPQPFDTVRAAMKVGRSGGLWTSLEERLGAWLGGSEIGWAGSLRESAVERWLDDCEELAGGMRVAIDIDKLRVELERLVETWPRQQVYNLPLAPS